MLLFACSTSKTTIKEPETPREIVEAFIEAVKAGDLDKCVKFMTARRVEKLKSDFDKLVPEFQKVDFVLESDSCESFTDDGVAFEGCVFHYNHTEFGIFTVVGSGQWEILRYRK